MKLIVGLGNPGEKYRGTRHNVGFDVLDLLAQRANVAFATAPVEAVQAKWRRPDEVILLVKPLTFMNLSGGAVAGLVGFYKIEVPDLLVISDDTNLPLGRLRARATGSEGGHNGLRSVAESLGTIEYSRLRVGVGRGDMRRDLANHVLARFAPDELPGIEAAIARAADAAEMWISEGLAKMMNMYNRAEEESSS
jgi:PTH1 family peptidyl-tRNA hydrolase